MEQSDLLRFAVTALERLAVPYLITGSTATIAFGEPRFTNDIDIVVDLRPQHVARFCQSFPAPEFYSSEPAIRDAMKNATQFNVLHPATGLKIDFMVYQDTAFDRSRFKRGLRIKPAADYDAMFAAPEDVIIKKMEYYKMGGSEKHLRDITGVLRVSGDRIDHAYVSDWTERLGLEEIWNAILARIRSAENPPS